MCILYNKIVYPSSGTLLKSITVVISLALSGLADIKEINNSTSFYLHALTDGQIMKVYGVTCILFLMMQEDVEI